MGQPTWQLLTAARTLWQEARGEPPIGQEAVAHVLWNRVRAGRWGRTLASVCLWHAQFSGWASTDPNFQPACALNDADPTLEALAQIVTDAQTATDPTNGALFYFATSIPEPQWAKTMTFCGQFGNQRFFK